METVCIGIQARSTSKRFPGKVFELIGGKEMLRHVVEAVDRAAFYTNRTSFRHGVTVRYAVLCPFKDMIKEKYSSRAMVIEGPEDDVLTRYMTMAQQLNASYIVRVTGDCPLLPPYLITKHIKIALANKYDYCSNVDPKYRTSMDGYDVEVFSRRALDWANETATEPSDREHVTTRMRSRNFSEERFTTGLVVGHHNFSHIKASVDTVDDLEFVRTEYDRIHSKIKLAHTALGRDHVHQV